MSISEERSIVNAGLKHFEGLLIKRTELLQSAYGNFWQTALENDIIIDHINNQLKHLKMWNVDLRKRERIHNEEILHNQP